MEYSEEELFWMILRGDIKQSCDNCAHYVHEHSGRCVVMAGIACTTNKDPRAKRDYWEWDGKVLSEDDEEGDDEYAQDEW